MYMVPLQTLMRSTCPSLSTSKFFSFLYIPTSTYELSTPPYPTSHFSSSFLSYHNPSVSFLTPLCVPSSTTRLHTHLPQQDRLHCKICLGSNPEPRPDIVQSRSKRKDQCFPVPHHARKNAQEIRMFISSGRCS